MESDKSVKLSTSEKADIFEYVNSMYLHLTGDKKKQTKRSFKTTWKEDNMCFILMMKLNEVYDIWSENEQKEDWLYDLEIHKNSEQKSVSMIKYRRHLNFQNEEREYYETELEKVKEGKGYISQEAHDEAMKELKQEKDNIIQEKGQIIGKLRSDDNARKEMVAKAKKEVAEVRKYYEKQMDILIKGQEKAEQ